MDINNTFIELTKYTIPYGHEHLLTRFLPKGTKKDSFGNCVHQIGNSETMFCCHMDTAGSKFEKVNQIIEGDIIRTDGTTILGGDNKCGMTILLYMIENKVPGTYFFFVGEEVGTIGSESALKKYPNFFKKFKRVIAFDRREMGSVITRQFARTCCSSEFSDALIEEFGKCNLSFRKDPTGVYTDSAVFMDTISEITNLSSGAWNEHRTTELVHLAYLRKVAEAACKINWESLPAVRVPSKISTPMSFGKKIAKYLSYGQMKTSEDTFKKVEDLMYSFDYRCLNKNEFMSGRDMVFSHWSLEDEKIIKIEGEKILYDGKEFKDFDALYTWIEGIDYDYDDDDEMGFDDTDKLEPSKKLEPNEVVNKNLSTSSPLEDKKYKINGKLVSEEEFRKEVIENQKKQLAEEKEKDRKLKQNKRNFLDKEIDLKDVDVSDDGSTDGSTDNEPF